MERTADFRTLDRIINTTNLNSCMNTAEMVSEKIFRKTDKDMIKPDGRARSYRLASTGIKIYGFGHRCCTSTVSTEGAFKDLRENEIKIAKNMIRENLRRAGYRNISFKENTLTATFIY